MKSLKIGGIISAAFVAGAFIASPELRAYAANTIGSADIIDESIQSVDIKNSQVKASDIATDAVGAAEIVGVTKLLFASCSTDEAVGGSATPNAALNVTCTIPGVDSSDHVIATLKGGHNFCYFPQNVVPASGKVFVLLSGVCQSAPDFVAGDRISLIVYDK